MNKFPLVYNIPWHIGRHSGMHIKGVGIIIPTCVGNIVPSPMIAILCICRNYTSAPSRRLSYDYYKVKLCSYASD